MLHARELGITSSFLTNGAFLEVDPSSLLQLLESDELATARTAASRPELAREQVAL